MITLPETMQSKLFYYLSLSPFDGDRSIFLEGIPVYIYNNNREITLPLLEWFCKAIDDANNIESYNLAANFASAFLYVALRLPEEEREKPDIQAKLQECLRVARRIEYAGMDTLLVDTYTAELASVIKLIEGLDKEQSGAKII
jgi:hypothetical protein